MPLVAGPFLPKGHVAVKILGWGREPCPGRIPGGLLGGGGGHVTNLPLLRHSFSEATEPLPRTRHGTRSQGRKEKSRTVSDSGGTRSVGGGCRLQRNHFHRRKVNSEKRWGGGAMEPTKGKKHRRPERGRGGISAEPGLVT